MTRLSDSASDPLGRATARVFHRLQSTSHMTLDELAPYMDMSVAALCWKAHHGRFTTSELNDMADVVGVTLQTVWDMLLDEMAREPPSNPLRHDA